MKSFKNYMLFFLVGSLSYWVPDILFHWLYPSILLITFGAPLVTMLIWKQCARRNPFNLHSIGFPFLMLLGIWVIGPLAIAVGMVPLGGTFLRQNELIEFFWVWVYFPAATFIMSTYSGSLGGLLIITLCLLFVGLSAILKCILNGKSDTRTNLP